MFTVDDCDSVTRHACKIAQISSGSGSIHDSCLTAVFTITASATASMSWCSSIESCAGRLSNDVPACVVRDPSCTDFVYTG